MARPFPVPETTPGYRPHFPMPGFNPALNLIIQVPPTSSQIARSWRRSYFTLSNLDSSCRSSTSANCQACKDRNTRLLSGWDAHLKQGVQIHDTFLELGVETRNVDMNYQVRPSTGRTTPLRSYNPIYRPSSPLFTCHPPEHSEPEGQDVVIYYHVGGSRVGNLGSEDLACRRIYKELGCTVYSCDYCLMPQYTADEAYSDAVEAFDGIFRMRKGKRWW